LNYHKFNKIQKKLKSFLKKINIVYIPLNKKDIKILKKYKINITEKELNKIIKIYNKNKFTLPTVVKFN